MIGMVLRDCPECGAFIRLLNGGMLRKHYRTSADGMRRVCRGRYTPEERAHDLMDEETGIELSREELEAAIAAQIREAEAEAESRGCRHGTRDGEQEGYAAGEAAGHKRGVLEEREACARLAEGLPKRVEHDVISGEMGAGAYGTLCGQARALALLIRGRPLP